MYIYVCMHSEDEFRQNWKPSPLWPQSGFRKIDKKGEYIVQLWLIWFFYYWKKLIRRLKKNITHLDIRITIGHGTFNAIFVRFFRWPPQIFSFHFGLNFPFFFVGKLCQTFYFSKRNNSNVCSNYWNGTPTGDIS